MEIREKNMPHKWDRERERKNNENLTAKTKEEKRTTEWEKRIHSTISIVYVTRTYLT